MKPEDILEQLRDIHLPEAGGPPLASTFALWPFLVFAGFVLVVAIARMIGRNRWRRSARAELAEIADIADPDLRWTGLLTFASTLSERSGRAITLPEVAFRNPNAIDPAEREGFVAFLRAELVR